MAQILLYGATGYTGRLVARELVRTGAAPVLVGRSGDRLRTLVEDLEPLAPSGRSATSAVADLGEPGSLRRLLQSPDDVLVSVVAPYTRVGSVLVEAAIDAGCAYLDCSAEPAFVRRVFDHYGQPARRAGARLLPGMGNEFVSGNLAAALLIDRFAHEQLVRLDVGYFVTGPFGTSSGSVASAAAVTLDPSFVFRAGRVAAERPGASVRSFDVDGHSMSAISLGGSEALSLPRTAPDLRQVTVYVGWLGRWSRVTAAAGALTANALSVPGVSSAVGAVFRTALGGASAAGQADHVRARSRAVAVAEGFAAGGTRIGRVEVEGQNPYDLTASLLTWSARMLARRAEKDVGALGPIDAFGLDAVASGCLALGLVEVD